MSDASYLSDSLVNNLPRKSASLNALKMEYTSRTPDVWCLFRTETDDYTYSFEVLLGVFLTEEAAYAEIPKILENRSFRKETDYNVRPYYLNQLDGDFEP